MCERTHLCVFRVYLSLVPLLRSPFKSFSKVLEFSAVRQLNVFACRSYSIFPNIESSTGATFSNQSTRVACVRESCLFFPSAAVRESCPSRGYNRRALAMGRLRYAGRPGGRRSAREGEREEEGGEGTRREERDHQRQGRPRGTQSGGAPQSSPPKGQREQRRS